ncbi:MAG: CBS domain-containing protein [Desulfobacteraceae bacterium]|nr:MAG: CBS domain-containing protein [Desulfobacteraceae bacterium]
MLLQDILGEAGRRAFTIEEDRNIEEAAKLMADLPTSSLLVIRSKKTTGIITEHDIVRAFKKAGQRPISEMSIPEVMTNKVIVATPQDDLDSSIALMLKADIRHLPVIRGEEIVAMLHLCDLAHYKVEILSSEVRYLEDYVRDLHGAITD